MKNNIQNLVDKKIAVLGYGVNNQKLVSWFLKHGIKDITICDRNQDLKKLVQGKIEIADIKFQLGDKYLDGLSEFDIVFRTPGIPYLHTKIQQAQEDGVKISSQTKLFFEMCLGKIIGITGTKGKGTTATLIYKILELSFKDDNDKSKVYLAGNMGIDPFEFLDDIEANDWVVMELSSFQLQDMDISPQIAVVLNITSDHLDHHKNQQEYIDAKSNIVRHQTKDDYAIINQDYLTAFEFAVSSPTDNDYYFSTKKSVDLGTYVQINDQKIVFNGEQNKEEIIDISQIKLLGKHNLENICAATTVAKILDVDNKYIQQILKSFSGNEHRLEFVAEIDGVKYYNDSASTNPDTTRAAIESFTSPIILIAGGSDKGLDYSVLKNVLNKQKIKKIILMGETADKIKKVIEDDLDIVEVNDIKSAVNEAGKNLKKGDIVLLSPASASFGLFLNYQDRGNQFKSNIKKR